MCISIIKLIVSVRYFISRKPTSCRRLRYPLRLLRTVRRSQWSLVRGIRDQRERETACSRWDHRCSQYSDIIPDRPYRADTTKTVCKFVFQLWDGWRSNEVYGAQSYWYNVESCLNFQSQKLFIVIQSYSQVQGIFSIFLTYIKFRNIIVSGSY